MTTGREAQEDDKGPYHKGKWPSMPLIAVALICAMVLFVFHNYLLGTALMLFKGAGSDTLNFNYPFTFGVARYIVAHGLPSWSFSLGMGQSLLPFFLHDPFDLLFYLSGSNHIAYGIACKEALKIGLTGITFFYYLKAMRLSGFTALTGSLLFSFSGFAIVGSCWYIFSFEAFNMALLLLAFELLLARRQWYLFTIAILLICISQPFNLYVYGLFLALYAFLRLWQAGDLYLQSCCRLFLRMSGAALLGMMISAPLLLENIAGLRASPRGSGTNSMAHILSSRPLLAMPGRWETGTIIMRFFASTLQGTGAHFNGWGNFLEAPLLYCGIPSLLLMPQIFCTPGRRKRIVLLAFLLLWMLPLAFPYFRYAFWLFAGNYYRAYSLFVAFVFLFYSLLALEAIIKTRKVNMPVLLCTGIALLLLLNYPFFGDKTLLNFPDLPALQPTVYYFVTTMIVVYVALIGLCGRAGLAGYGRYLLLAAIVGELCYLSADTVNNMEAVQASEWTAGNGYADNTLQTLDYISRADSSFFRIDKTYSSSPSRFTSMNDGMVQGYRGTSGYNPFNQPYYIAYLQLMGIADKTDEFQSRWAAGLVSRPVLESQNRVKYLLSKTQLVPPLKGCYDSVATFGNVSLFRNKYVLPFGYCYTRYISESAFAALPVAQKDRIAMQACVIRGQDIAKIKNLHPLAWIDTAVTRDTGIANINAHVALHEDTLKLTSFQETHIQGTITARNSEMMYLAIPYDRGWALKVDGHKQDKFILSGGMTGILISSGEHKIDLSYELPFFRLGLLISAFGILFLATALIYTRKKRIAVYLQRVIDTDAWG